MKNIITTVVIILITLTVGNGQIKKNPKVKIPAKNTITIGSSNLDMEKIKTHISSGTYCYELNVSSTAIIPPKHPQKLKAIDAYFTTTRNVKVERNYLRTNGLLLRSDKAFSRTRGNNYEVLIYPDRSDKRKIDKNQVKITWNTPEKGLNTFHLKNVAIQYKPYGILIIGDYEIDGIVFGVSIGLIPTTCLI